MVGSNYLQLASSAEVLQSNLDTLAHGLFTLTDPDTGVEVLLVGLVSTVGVANCCQEVVLLVQNVVTNARQVGELHVSVEVDLNDTVADGLLVFCLGGSGTTVENEEDGLVIGGADLLLDVGLVLLEQLRVQADVAGLVDTVHVTETGGDGEVGADGGEGLVDGEDILGLGVEGVVVDILVVDTVLLTTSDTDFLQPVSNCSNLSNVSMRAFKTYHLEPLLQGSGTLEVLGGSLDVPVDGLLRQIDHVAGEERLAVELEVSLILVEQAIEPWQQLLSTVIGVQNDGDTVGGSDATDVVSTGDTTSNGGLLLAVGNTLEDELVSHLHPNSPGRHRTYLASEVSSTTVGKLQDDGGLQVAGSLESSHDGRGGGHVLKSERR